MENRILDERILVWCKDCGGLGYLLGRYMCIHEKSPSGQNPQKWSPYDEEEVTCSRCNGQGRVIESFRIINPLTM